MGLAGTNCFQAEHAACFFRLPGELHPAEMDAYEFLRRNGLGRVAGGFHDDKMRVFGYDEIRLRCDGAVADNVGIEANRHA